MGKRRDSRCLAFDKEEFLKQHKKSTTFKKKKDWLILPHSNSEQCSAKDTIKNEIEASNREEAIQLSKDYHLVRERYSTHKKSQ